jgi:hypothetical protein
MTPRVRIFINYRREDSSGHAGRLYDALVDRFGEDQVFMDVDAIEPGTDFKQVIDQAVSSCDVVVALIGRNWLRAVDSRGGLRLDNPGDFVRLEIEAALTRKTRLIPALVQGAGVPQPSDLPSTLASLSTRNAIELSDGRWRYDVGRLIRSIEQTENVDQGRDEEGSTFVRVSSRRSLVGKVFKRRSRWIPRPVFVLLGVLVLVAAAAAMSLRTPSVSTAAQTRDGSIVFSVLVGGTGKGCGAPCPQTDGDIYVLNRDGGQAVPWTFGSSDDQEAHTLPGGEIGFLRDEIPSVVREPGGEVTVDSRVPEDVSAWDVSSVGDVAYYDWRIQECLCVRRTGESPLKLDVLPHVGRQDPPLHLYQLEFSPDGSSLAFLVDEDLYTVILGKDLHANLTPTLVHRNVQSFDWSPSGLNLVFSAVRPWEPPPGTFYYCTPEKTKLCHLSYDLFVADLAAGDSRLLMNTQANEDYPAWGADNEIFFVRGNGDLAKETLWKIDLDEPGSQSRLQTPFDEASYTGLSWGVL